MICLALSPEDKARLEQARRTRPQIAERCHYVLLNAEGWSVPRIARRLDRNEHTIRTWLKAYQTAGLQGLQNPPQSGRPATKGQDVSAQLEHLLTQRPSHFGDCDPRPVASMTRSAFRARSAASRGCSEASNGEPASTASMRSRSAMACAGDVRS